MASKAVIQVVPSTPNGTAISCNNNNNSHSSSSESKMLQIALMSVTIAPLRCFGFFFFLLVGYVVSSVGLIGVSAAELESSSLKGWRRNLQNLCYMCGRAMYFCLGIHWITVLGERASPVDAPVLVVAPHATIIDTVAIVASRSVPVGKAEFARAPILGRIARFMQVLLVKRENEESRKKTLRNIQKYAQNVQSSDKEEPGRPLLLFPEGTCTNGKALIHFKAGAFYSGVPVQPMVLRFPSRPDTLTWTWDQSYGTYACFWLTMCQFNTRVEIEYLPIHVPSEAEVSDPRLYGRNIRSQMGKALGVPAVNLRLEDGKEAAASRDVLNIILDDTSSDDDDDDEAGEGKKKHKKHINYIDFSGNLALMA